MRFCNRQRALNFQTPKLLKWHGIMSFIGYRRDAGEWLNVIWLAAGQELRYARPMWLFREVEFVRIRMHIIMAAMLFLAFAMAAVAAPVVFCAAPVHEFGTQTDDGVVRHVFMINNRGDVPLVLRLGRACCGAQLTVPEQPVAPDSMAEVRVDLILRGRSGKVAKVVYVQTNDPKQPLLRLELNGRVVVLPGPPPS